MSNLRSWKVGLVSCAAVLSSSACGGNVGGTDSGAGDDYPSDTITLVVPWAPGGGTDAVGRALAKAMSDVGDVNVVVENRDGAGSALGSGHVQNAEADGYTLLFNTASVITQTFISRSDGTDTVDYEELIPVANVNIDPYTMQVGPDSPWDTLTELLDHARANPGEVSIGVAGIGSQSQLIVPLIESEAGVEFNQVSFDGSGPINNALMGGDVDAHAPALGDFVSHIEDGAIKLLAVAGDERDDKFPDTPTFKEEGPDISYDLFRGVWAPADTPTEIVEKVEELVLEAAESEEFQQTLEELGFGTASWTTEEFQDEVTEQAELLEGLMRDEGLID